MNELIIARIATGLVALYAGLSFKWPAMTILFRLKPGWQKMFRVSDNANTVIGRVITPSIGIMALLVFVGSFLLPVFS